MLLMSPEEQGNKERSMASIMVPCASDFNFVLSGYHSVVILKSTII